MILFYPEAGGSIFLWNTDTSTRLYNILTKMTVSSEEICIYDHLFNPGVANLKINQKQISAGKIKYQ